MSGQTAIRAPRQPKPKPDPLVHSINDAVQISGLSRATIYRHGKAGRLRLVKVGGRTLVNAESLRTLLATPWTEA